MAKKKTASEIVEESFDQDSRAVLHKLSNEEFRGYVVANVVLNNLSAGYGVSDYLEAVRELFPSNP